MVWYAYIYGYTYYQYTTLICPYATQAFGTFSKFFLRLFEHLHQSIGIQMSSYSYIATT